MDAKEFNNKVRSQVKLTIPVTITAFTQGTGISAVGQVLEALGKALSAQGVDITNWYIWDSAWLTEVQMGDIKAPQVLPAAKMEEPAEVPGEAEVADA